MEEKLKKIDDLLKEEIITKEEYNDLRKKIIRDSVFSTEVSEPEKTAQPRFVRSYQFVKKINPYIKYLYLGSALLILLVIYRATLPQSVFYDSFQYYQWQPLDSQITVYDTTLFNQFWDELGWSGYVTPWSIVFVGILYVIFSFMYFIKKTPRFLLELFGLFGVLYSAIELSGGVFYHEWYDPVYPNSTQLGFADFIDYYYNEVFILFIVSALILLVVFIRILEIQYSRKRKNE